MVTGSGNAAQETRQLAGWTAVTLSCPGTLDVEIGENRGIDIEADDNILPLIETVVDGGTLTIRLKPGQSSIRPLTPIQMRAATPEIEAMAVSGAGNIHAAPISGSQLALNVSGSGNLHAASVEVERLDTRLSGSGSVAIGGRTTDHEIRINGSGSLDGRSLVSQRAHVSLSGSGSAMIHVDREIDGRVSGSGSIVYSGQATTNVRTSGSGRAVRMPD